MSGAGLMSVQTAYAKNGKGRSGPMNKALTETLRMIKMYDSLIMVVVFCSTHGTLYRSFRASFERAVRQAGIEKVAVHNLRHAFASRLVMAGVDLPTVKERMGHKHINMTMRYTHLSSSHKHNVMSGLENVDDQVPSIFIAGDANQNPTSSQVAGFPSLPR